MAQLLLPLPVHAIPAKRLKGRRLLAPEAGPTTLFARPLDQLLLALGLARLHILRLDYLPD